MPKTITEAYDELWHYTSAAGAQGIISSGSLWATSAEFLNDPREITHFFDARMPELVKPAIHKLAHEMANDPANNASQMKAAGNLEKTIDVETQDLVDRYRSATLHVNNPHIFSMTAPTDSRVRDSGLLSQWRGYGLDGGCALVFDRIGIKRLIKKEMGSFYYQYLEMHPVYYNYRRSEDTPEPSEKYIAELEDKFAALLARQIRGQNAQEESEFYETMTSLSCLYKHWGFHEEHEVRIIAVPNSPEVAEAAKKDGEGLREKAFKTFLRSGIHVPYIELFASPKGVRTEPNLPLKRVVIGPHIDAEKRRRSVERLLRIHGYSVPVECSDIKYLGR